MSAPLDTDADDRQLLIAGYPLHYIVFTIIVQQYYDVVVAILGRRIYFNETRQYFIY